jgi:hypothetical protein
MKTSRKETLIQLDRYSGLHYERQRKEDGLLFELDESDVHAAELTIYRGSVSCAHPSFSQKDLFVNEEMAWEAACIQISVFYEDRGQWVVIVDPLARDETIVSQIKRKEFKAAAESFSDMYSGLRFSVRTVNIRSTPEPYKISVPGNVLTR